MTNTDLLDYRNEIRDIVNSELEKLERFEQELDKCTAMYKSPIDKHVLKWAKNDAKDAEYRLTYLKQYVMSDRLFNVETDFNEIIKIAGYAFKRSAAARTSLMRHSPSLHGNPVSLDPSQNHVLNPGTHRVDYGRGGYFHYPSLDPAIPSRYTDHPILKQIAGSIASKLYGDVNVKALLFTCALGAMSTMYDYMRNFASQTDRTILVGKRIWTEVKKYIDDSFSGSIQFIDETNSAAIEAALRDETVFGIGLETIINHPEMPAVDMTKLASIVKSTRFNQPKVLFIDTVHTPEFNPYSKYFSDELPANLCLGTVVSGVKFSQAGWDISKSGLLALAYNNDDYPANQSPYDKIVELRGGSGRVLSMEEAMLADIMTSKSFQSVLSRYDRNAKYLAENLNKGLMDNDLGYVSSPWLTTHPFHEIAMDTYGSGGRIVYAHLNHKRIPCQGLVELYADLADYTESHNSYLAVASTFGLSSPHIHLILHPDSGPILRLSPGSTDLGTVKKMTELCIEFLKKRAGIPGENRKTEISKRIMKQ